MTAVDNNVLIVFYFCVLLLHIGAETGGQGDMSPIMCLGRQYFAIELIIYERFQ